MSWGAVIAGGAAIVGGAVAGSGAKKAAKASASADQAAIDEQRRQFDLARGDLAPYRNTGTGALNKLNELYGIPQYSAPAPTQYAPSVQGSPASGGGEKIPIYGPKRRIIGYRNADPSSGGQSGLTPIGGYTQYGPGQMEDTGPTAFRGPDGQPSGPPSAGPDYSAFYNSPDYKFGLDQGLQAVQGSAAARGGLYSGNALKAINDYGSGYASQQYGNYTNRLAALAGIGQTATNTGVSAGMGYAGNIGSLMQSQGDARASGIAGSANAWGNTLGTLGGLASNYFSNRSDPLAYYDINAIGRQRVGG